MQGRSKNLLVVTLLSGVVVTGACNKQEGTVLERSTGTGAVQSSLTVRLPSQLLGLQVRQEQAAIDKSIKDTKRPYVDSVGMFSLRENDLLRATLQVSRLNRVARPRSLAFRENIVSLMGTSSPLEIKVGDTLVYNTTGNKQNLFAWFHKKQFYVLSVHEDYEFPRTLLRQVVELQEEQEA